MNLRYCWAFVMSFGWLTAALHGAVAADPPPKQPAAEEITAEEFATLYDETLELVGKLQDLQARYQKANPKDRPAIVEEFKELGPQFEEKQTRLLKLQPQVEQLYLKDPKNEKAAQFLADSAQGAFIKDDYEECIRLAKLLREQGFEDKGIHEAIGMAAFRMMDLDTAEKELSEADEAKALSPEGQSVLSNLPKFRTAWEIEEQIRAAEAKADDLPRVKLETSKGDLVIELFENEAPNTVANFVSLVEKGFYNGLVFHRVLPGFMAQGGDPQGDGTGGPGYNIACECGQKNARKHYRGSLSMAHAGKDTGGSQFFVTFHPTSFLDNKHTVFGRVVEGLEVLKDLQRIDPQRPGNVEPDKIVEATVVRKRNHKYEPKKVAEKSSKPTKKGE